LEIDLACFCLLLATPSIEIICAPTVIASGDNYFTTETSDIFSPSHYRNRIKMNKNYVLVINTVGMTFKHCYMKERVVLTHKFIFCLQHLDVYLTGVSGGIYMWEFF